MGHGSGFYLHCREKAVERHHLHRLLDLKAQVVVVEVLVAHVHVVAIGVVVVEVVVTVVAEVHVVAVVVVGKVGVLVEVFVAFVEWVLEHDSLSHDAVFVLGIKSPNCIKIPKLHDTAWSPYHKVLLQF